VRAGLPGMHMDRPDCAVARPVIDRRRRHPRVNVRFAPPGGVR